MNKSLPENGIDSRERPWKISPKTVPAGKWAFTLIEILLALALSGLALTATLYLLNQFVRDVDSTARDTWVEIEKARFITFVEGILSEASHRDSLEWIPPANDPEYRGLDWVLSLPPTDSAIGQTEEGRPILPAGFELGWGRTEGLVLREAVENNLAQPLPFRPLLEENPFERVVFYRFTDSPLRFEEIRPPRSADEENPGQPRILKLVFSEASERSEAIWIYLPRPPDQSAGSNGPRTSPPTDGPPTPPGQPGQPGPPAGPGQPGQPTGPVQPGQPPDLRLQAPRQQPNAPQQGMTPPTISR